MAPIYLGKRVVPSSLRYIENLASTMVIEARNWKVYTNIFEFAI